MLPRTDANNLGSLVSVAEELDAEIAAQRTVNCALWIEETFPIELDDWQIAVCHDVSLGNNVAIQACNGAGKTAVVAGIINWWLETQGNDNIVMSTASSWRQVEAFLWGEIHSLRSRAKRALGGRLLTTSLHYGAKHYGMGFSSDDPGLVEGAHAAKVLVVIDEAKSVSRAIFDALERLESTGQRVQRVVISTPGGKNTAFADCFTKERDRYKCYRIPARPSTSTPWVAKRIRPAWIARMLRKFGPDHPMVKSAVDAEFYDADESSCAQIEWCEAAVSNRDKLTPAPEATRNMGVDVARSFSGDSSVLVTTVGAVVVDMKTIRTDNLMTVAGEVVAMAKKHDVSPGRISIDDTGVGGGVVDRLIEEGWSVNPVSFGGGAVDKESFDMRATEMWWHTCEALRERRAGIPNDEDLIAQLTTRHWRERDSRGRLRLESKDALRERGLPSPDKADAYVLAVAGLEEDLPPFQYTPVATARNTTRTIKRERGRRLLM